MMFRYRIYLTKTFLNACFEFLVQIFKKSEFSVITGRNSVFKRLILGSKLILLPNQNITNNNSFFTCRITLEDNTSSLVFHQAI